MRGYTIAQVRAFIDAIERRAASERLTRLMDYRASQYEKKSFEQYVKEIK